MIFEFGQYKLNIDVDKTRLFYERSRLVTAGCTCSGCHNYEQAVKNISSEVVEFFNDLGVDMRKVCEVYVNCRNSDDTLLYGGFYHLCGTLLTGKTAWVPTSASTSHWQESQAFQIAPSFLVSFQTECDLLENEFPMPSLQMEISANIPWVLSKQNPY